MRQVELLRHVRLRILYQAGPLGLWCDCGLRRVERRTYKHIHMLPPYHTYRGHLQVAQVAGA